jgi:hypothetical protein
LHCGCTAIALLCPRIALITLRRLHCQYTVVSLENGLVAGGIGGMENYHQARLPTSFNLYASADDRAEVIAGLYKLAHFLEENPEVPTPRTITVSVFPPTGLTDTERRAEIDLVASRIGAETRESAGGHYIASLRFGPVEYSAVAIPRYPTDRGR